MKVIDTIVEALEAKLAGTPYFLVAAKLGGGGKLLVQLDGDTGIDIAYCGEINRYIGDFIEEKALIEHAYTIEVGSAGIDEPLIYARQYPKHKGRQLWVLSADGKEYRGVITDTYAEYIVLYCVKGKGKSKIEETVEIPFNHIKKAKIVLDF